MIILLMLPEEMPSCAPWFWIRVEGPCVSAATEAGPCEGDAGLNPTLADNGPDQRRAPRIGQCQARRRRDD